MKLLNSVVVVVDLRHSKNLSFMRGEYKQHSFLVGSFWTISSLSILYHSIFIIHYNATTLRCNTFRASRCEAKCNTINWWWSVQLSRVFQDFVSVFYLAFFSHVPRTYTHTHTHTYKHESRMREKVNI